MTEQPSVYVGLSQAEGVYELALSGEPWSFMLYGSLEDFDALALRIEAAVNEQHAREAEDRA